MVRFTCAGCWRRSLSQCEVAVFDPPVLRDRPVGDLFSLALPPLVAPAPGSSVAAPLSSPDHLCSFSNRNKRATWFRFMVSLGKYANDMFFLLFEVPHPALVKFSGSASSFSRPLYYPHVGWGALGRCLMDRHETPAPEALPSRLLSLFLSSCSERWTLSITAFDSASIHPTNRRRQSKAMP